MSDASTDTARPTETETRQVRVADPALSPETNRLVSAEVRDVIGSDSVVVPADRTHFAEGARRTATTSSVNRLGWLTAALLLVVVAVVGLLVGASWWLVPVALLVVLAALATIVGGVLRATSIREHPSPTTAAALQAEGVDSPDEYLSDIVDELTEPSTDGSGEHRTVSAHEDPARAGAEHKDSMTPTSGRSKAVGPQ